MVAVVGGSDCRGNLRIYLVSSYLRWTVRVGGSSYRSIATSVLVSHSHTQHRSVDETARHDMEDEIFLERQSYVLAINLDSHERGRQGCACCRLFRSISRMLGKRDDFQQILDVALLLNSKSKKKAKAHLSSHCAINRQCVSVTALPYVGISFPSFLLLRLDDRYDISQT